MLKRYLDQKLEESEELIYQTRVEINNLKRKIREQNELASSLEKEYNANSSIFSPRNHREENKKKLTGLKEEINKLNSALLKKQEALMQQQKDQEAYYAMKEESETPGEMIRQEHGIFGHSMTTEEMEQDQMKNAISAFDDERTEQEKSESECETSQPFLREMDKIQKREKPENNDLKDSVNEEKAGFENTNSFLMATQEKPEKDNSENNISKASLTEEKTDQERSDFVFPGEQENQGRGDSENNISSIPLIEENTDREIQERNDSERSNSENFLIEDRIDQGIHKEDNPERSISESSLIEEYADQEVQKGNSPEKNVSQNALVEVSANQEIQEKEYSGRDSLKTPLAENQILASSLMTEQEKDDTVVELKEAQRKIVAEDISVINLGDTLKTDDVGQEKIETGKATVVNEKSDFNNDHSGQRKADSIDVSRETFLEEDIERERYQAAARITQEIKKLGDYANSRGKRFSDNTDDSHYVNLEGTQTPPRKQGIEDLNLEIKSDELIILESERKKEREFLQEIYIKTERALALLNGNKNLCKKELQQIRKMIYNYVQSIKE